MKGLLTEKYEKLLSTLQSGNLDNYVQDTYSYYKLINQNRICMYWNKIKYLVLMYEGMLCKVQVANILSKNDINFTAEIFSFFRNLDMDTSEIRSEKYFERTQSPKETLYMNYLLSRLIQKSVEICTAYYRGVPVNPSFEGTFIFIDFYEYLFCVLTYEEYTNSVYILMENCGDLSTAKQIYDNFNAKVQRLYQSEIDAAENKRNTVMGTFRPTSPPAEPSTPQSIVIDSDAESSSDELD